MAEPVRDWHTIHAVPDHPLLAAHHLLRWQHQQAQCERLAFLRGYPMQRTLYRLHRTPAGLVVQWSPVWRVKGES